MFTRYFNFAFESEIKVRLMYQRKKSIKLCIKVLQFLVFKTLRQHLIFSVNSEATYSVGGKKSELFYEIENFTLSLIG